MKFAAKIASFIFHPVFIPTMVTGCYYYFNAVFYLPLERYVATGQVFLMTCLLLVSIYFFLKSLGLLRSSIMVDNVKERSVPMFLNIFITCILIFRVWENVTNNALKQFFIAFTASYFILFCSALFKKKYSVHVACLSSTLPLFVQQSTAYFLPSIMVLPVLLLLIGWVASSRLYLNAHTNIEIIMGGIIGFVPSFIVFFL
ncbi:MAG TPA: hypothetical protein VKY44_06205 [Flavobacterium sp.]|nr:hypothetical protein [Flavobacterium sp.]